MRIAKVVDKAAADSERLLREAALIRNIKHSGIPIIYDSFEDTNSICIVEEYISGKSLTDYMKDSPKLSDRQIADIGIKICNILEYLHYDSDNCILHLDIKPDNIIIRDNLEVVIIDYDSSVIKGQWASQCYGSTGFASPEQYHRLHLDVEADIYGVGMSLMYMAQGGHITSMADEGLHQSQLYPIIKKCTRHNKYQRFKSIFEVRRLLEQIVAHSVNLCQSLEKKQRNNLILDRSEQSQVIYVHGMKRGIGTTHICLCISSFLSRMGEKVICMEISDRQDMRSEALKGKLMQDGTFYINGVYLLPDYNDGVDFNIKEYSFVVIDCGIGQAEYDRIQCESNNDVHIFIYDDGYRKREESEAMRNLPEAEIIFVNHISGKRFYEFLSENKDRRSYYRIPCIYEWYMKNEVFDDMVREALAGKYPWLISRKKNIYQGVVRFVKRNIGNLKKEKLF